MIDWYVDHECDGSALVAFDESGKFIGSAHLELCPDSPERQAQAILEAANEILEARP